MKKRLFILLFLTAVILVGGCETYRQNDYQPYYVVESYLIAGRNLSRVLVSKTVPVDEPYSFRKAALNNATVTVQQLDSGGTVKKRFFYRNQSSGVYIPTNPDRILSGHRYKLIVSFPNGDSVTAQTRVPGPFHPVGEVPDSAVYKSPDPISIDITPSYYPGRQAYFIFTVNAVNPAAGRLTPFYADEVTKDDNEVSDYKVMSSGIINQKNYAQNPNGTLTVELPWLSVAFYGQNKIVANAIDDNMYDFVRSASVQTGGSTLPPGQIQNIFYHVKGGIGIFGSMVSDTISVFIKKGNYH